MRIKVINSGEIYQSILHNRPHGQNLKPFTKVEIEAALNHFIHTEEYEKCALLKEFMEKRFNHQRGYFLPLLVSEL